MGQVQKHLDRQHHTSPVVAVCYNLLGTQAALATQSGELQVLDIEPGIQQSKEVGRLQVTGEPSHLAWANPEFGDVLACCTLSGDLHVWERQPSVGYDTKNPWALKAKLRSSGQPFRGIAFCPKQYGLMLASISDDGFVLVHEADSSLDAKTYHMQGRFKAHPGLEAVACCCLCWRQPSPRLPPLLLVGTASGAYAWRWNATLLTWQLAGHFCPDQAITAAHWAPTLGRPHDLLALASGSSVELLALEGAADDLQSTPVKTLAHPSAVLKVEFNMLGNTLAVSCTDARVYLWRPSLVGAWQQAGIIQGEESLEID